MKIYTRTGDDGTTGLFGGGRVSKNHERVEAYGAVDETNAVLGIAIAHTEDPEVGEKLVEIQARLFDLGALLATPPESRSSKSVRALREADIAQLEAWIDDADGSLPPLKSFILPGGSVVGAFLHHARTVVRRAERRSAGLVQDGDVDGSALRYLNRLSDFLFVLARLVNRREGVDDIAWSGPKRDDA